VHTVVDEQVEQPAGHRVIVPPINAEAMLFEGLTEQAPDIKEYPAKQLVQDPEVQIMQLELQAEQVPLFT
jgi:hypothetical protein